MVSVGLRRSPSATATTSQRRSNRRSARIAARSAHAHHSHPFFYDQSRSITIEGRIERVQWKDPHTVIVLRLDDGTAYTVDWSGLSGLTNTEHFPDYAGEVNPNTVDPTLIRRVGDGFSWSVRPPRLPTANSVAVRETDRTASSYS